MDSALLFLPKRGRWRSSLSATLSENENADVQKQKQNSQEVFVFLDPFLPMSSSSTSLDLSFIKSLFGSNNVKPTNSTNSPQSNSIPVDPQQHGGQQSPSVEQQQHDQTDRNQAPVSRTAHSTPPPSSPLLKVETDILAARVARPSKPSTQHCHNGPLTISAAAPPSVPYTQQVSNNSLTSSVPAPQPMFPIQQIPNNPPMRSAPLPSQIPFTQQTPADYPSTSQSIEWKLQSQHHQKEKRKEGKRQRLHRMKQKQKMNQYNKVKGQTESGQC